MASPSSYGVAAPTAPKAAIAKSAKSKAKPAPRPKPTAAAPPAAVQGAAAQRYTGAFSGALNNLSDQEQREHDVATRRQADASQYAAYVMGQQGAIGGAAARQDVAAVGTLQGIQDKSVASGLSLQNTLMAQRAAQGGQGPVPAQQLSSTVDAQQKNNALLSGVIGNVADSSRTRQGEAGFLQAAALANLTAHQRGIAGQEFENVSSIRREKTGVLAQKTNAALDDKRAAQQAAADAYAADVAAASKAADRSSRENIEGAKLSAAESRDATDRAENRYQKSRDRQVSLQKSRNYAEAGGVSPIQIAKRNTSVKKIETSRSDAMARVQALRKTASQPNSGFSFSPAVIRGVLKDEFKNAPPEVIDYVLAAAFGRKAGVTKKGQPTAAARYTALINAIKSGKLNY